MPVYDSATHTVFLQVQNNSNVESVVSGQGWKAGQTWQISSSDVRDLYFNYHSHRPMTDHCPDGTKQAGVTWSKRRSLDSALGQFAGLYPGPANAGIKLSVQGSPYKGRLVFAGWNVPTKNFSAANDNYVVSYLIRQSSVILVATVILS